jgi:hypothetical protein
MPFSQKTLLPNNESRQGNADNRLQQVVLLLGFLAFICAAILFGIRAKLGLRLFEFCDESEKFVAAQMMNQGLHIYRDIFAHHGPVPYMIAHLYANIVSSTDFSLIRLAVVFLALLSCLSISFSPILKSITARVWVAAVYLSVLSSVWVLQGIHMLLYQQIGGFLFVIVLAQMVLPALLGEKMTRTGLFFSGFSLTLACFSAYSFGPAAVFFVISTFLSLIAFRENLSIYIKNIFIGIVSALSIVVLWLVSFGDLLGYLIYHFYFNQKIYAPFIGFSSRAILNNFNIAFTPHRRIDALSVFFFILWISVLVFIALNKTPKIKDALLKSGAIFFLFMAVLFVNPRGGYGFYNAGVVVINLAVISLTAALLLQNQFSKSSWSRLIPSILFMVLLVVGTEQVSRNAKSSPFKIAKKDFLAFVVDQKPEQGGIYDFIRSITKNEDKILSLIFNPSIYIKIGRLPASGHYYYLPWQAAYNHASVLDYKIDICKDIIANKPSVIYFYYQKVWGKYAIDKYEPCIIDLIKNRYSRLPGGNFYIRNDIAHDMMLDVSPVDYRLRPGSQFTRSPSTKLSMMTNDTGNPTQLKRMGVMFGTNGRQNPGDLELRLLGPDGVEFVQRFTLPDLTGRKYRYFDLTPAQYTAGEIVSVTGEGFSAWESYNATGDVRTCIIYEYNNGKKRFTPGCPLF